MQVRIQRHIQNRMWLGQDVITGVPVYVHVLNMKADMTNKIIEVTKTIQGEHWEVKQPNG